MDMPPEAVSLVRGVLENEMEREFYFLFFPKFVFSFFIFSRSTPGKKGLR